MLGNKTDGEFLNAILKLSNGLIPSSSGKFCSLTFTWAGDARSVEYINILSENTNSAFSTVLTISMITLPDAFLKHPMKPLSSLETFFDGLIARGDEIITPTTYPDTLRELLQKHDSGDLHIRNVDFLNPHIYSSGISIVKMLISRPEVPTMHILDAREICSNILERNPYDQYNSELIDMIDAELARRAEQ